MREMSKELMMRGNFFIDIRKRMEWIVFKVTELQRIIDEEYDRPLEENCSCTSEKNRSNGEVDNGTNEK